MLWKKLIERKVCTDSLWRGLAERRGWITSLFKPKPGEQHPNHSFYRRLYPSIIKDIEAIESNWRCGKHNLQRINCRSENSKGVYCLQYDDTKIGTYVLIYLCEDFLKKIMKSKFTEVYLVLYVSSYTSMKLIITVYTEHFDLKYWNLHFFAISFCFTLKKRPKLIK